MMNERKGSNKVGLIGAGMVGASFAYALMQHGVANELVLIDRDAARAEGEMAAFQCSAQTLKNRLAEVG